MQGRGKGYILNTKNRSLVSQTSSGITFPNVIFEVRCGQELLLTNVIAI